MVGSNINVDTHTATFLYTNTDQLEGMLEENALFAVTMAEMKHLPRTLKEICWTYMKKTLKSKGHFKKNT